MTFILPAIIVFFSALFLTKGLRHYALTHNVIDMPNSRSSHTVPTPRGGGVAIVISFLVAVICLWALGRLDREITAMLVVAGSIIAILGFLDDHGHIHAKWRLTGHFIAAGIVVYMLGGLPDLVCFGVSISLGLAGYLFGVLYLVWLLNLYNFMDGIDGIASVEGITTCLSGAFLYLLLGFSDSAALPLILAAAIAGFLFWNFPPARIFMGDAGSGFLGITLGILSLQAAWVAPQLFWSWVILLGVFIVDASLTLFRRILRGDKVYEAHRSHAYQYASRHFGQHKLITLSVFAINLVWLLPIAVLVGLGKIDGGLGVVIAYIPLIILALKFKAGAMNQ
jgi:Fuc2NAc and GlcNAc transferase